MSRLGFPRLVWMLAGLALLAASIRLWGPLNGGFFGFWLVAPDLLGLLLASLLGKPAGKGLLPVRGVPVYNLWHTYWLPLFVGGVAWLVNGRPPLELLLGWGLHLAADRTLGYGLRRSDGSIGPVTLWA